LGDVLKLRTASTLCPHHANLIVLFFFNNYRSSLYLYDLDAGGFSLQHEYKRFV